MRGGASGAKEKSRTVVEGLCSQRLHAQFEGAMEIPADDLRINHITISSTAEHAQAASVYGSV